MNRWLLAVGLLASGTARADWHLLELDEFSIDYARIENYDESYLPYVDPGKANGKEAWKDSTAANFNVSLLKYGDYGLYVDNKVHGESTTRQFRQVGWQFEAGMTFDSKVNFWWRHHSQHILDTTGTGHFPLLNELGCTVVFYRRGGDDASGRN